MSESIRNIVREMREFADTDSQSIGRDILRREIQYLADRIEAAYKQTVTDCNQSKMREALRYLRDASREFHHLILNSKHNEICDKYKYAPSAKISDAIANANAALSEPPRNCDLYDSEEDAWNAYLELHPNAECPNDEYEMWLFDPAEMEGGVE